MISTQIGTKRGCSSWLLWVLGLCPPVWRVKLGGAPGPPWPPPRGELGPPGRASPVQPSLSPLRGRGSSRPPCVEIKISRRVAIDATARRADRFPHGGDFSSCARFLASAARFLSFLVYLPASHSVASTASDKESRTRESHGKSPGSAAPRGRWDRSPRERANAAVRASSSREPSLRNNSAARTCVEINQ